LRSGVVGSAQERDDAGGEVKRRGERENCFARMGVDKVEGRKMKAMWDIESVKENRRREKELMGTTTM